MNTEFNIDPLLAEEIKDKNREERSELLQQLIIWTSQLAVMLQETDPPQQNQSRFRITLN